MGDDLEILLVEDNPADVELTLRALQENNLANCVHVAHDGEEALDFLYCRGAHSQRDANQRPRLVLLDLKLPRLDGLAVLRQVKSDPLLKAVPVIIMTSSNDERDLVRSYQLGVNSYLQKPVDFDQFRDIVRQLGLYWVLVNVAPPAAAFARPEPNRTR